jgi:hypothetical protein
MIAFFVGNRRLHARLVVVQALFLPRFPPRRVGDVFPRLVHHFHGDRNQDRDRARFEHDLRQGNDEDRGGSRRTHVRAAHRRGSVLRGGRSQDRTGDRHPAHHDAHARGQSGRRLRSVVWHLTEAYLRAPKVDPKVVEAARRIRAAFIPELGQLQDSYADEAEAAARRKGELSNLEADLKLIPVAGGGTLYDWAVMYLSAGEKLSVLLSQRADIDAKKRKNAQALRSETVGILNALRSGIGREVARNPELPKDLDAQIFGYFDTLEAQREAQNRAAKAAKGEAEEGGGK